MHTAPMTVIHRAEADRLRAALSQPMREYRWTWCFADGSTEESYVRSRSMESANANAEAAMLLSERPVTSITVELVP